MARRDSIMTKPKDSKSALRRLLAYLGAFKLPILLVSGEEDPVGDYGKGVKSVAEGLRATGHVNVTTKLYPGCRHEVLNETNRQEVTEDLLEWIRTVPEQ